MVIPIYPSTFWMLNADVWCFWVAHTTGKSAFGTGHGWPLVPVLTTGTRHPRPMAQAINTGWMTQYLWVPLHCVKRKYGPLQWLGFEPVTSCLTCTSFTTSSTTQLCLRRIYFSFEVTCETLLVPGGRHHPVPKARHRYRVIFSPGTNVKGSISTGW